MDFFNAWHFCKLRYLMFLDNRRVYYFIITINYSLVFYEYRKFYNDFVFIFKGSIFFDITVDLIVSYRMFRKEVIRLSLYFGGPQLQYNNCRSALF